jgi:hypothetical protein
MPCKRKKKTRIRVTPVNQNAPHSQESLPFFSWSTANPTFIFIIVFVNGMLLRRIRFHFVVLDQARCL